jgi:pimeloyl-ACP methyl ester carboxylesterase
MSGDEYVFVTRPGFGPRESAVRTDFDVESRLVLAACGDAAHVVAASYGAVSALGAAALDPRRVRSLVLVEPAAFSLGRGLPAVEAHIAAVAPVMARYAGMGAADFHVAFLGALGVTEVVPPDTESGLRRAERMRLQRPPWDAVLDPSVISRIPTLVVTGAWNAEYEELAARFVELGAEHAQLLGFGHSTHESPDFPALVEAFWARS